MIISTVFMVFFNITNSPKLSDFEQHTSIMSQFLWFRDSGAAWQADWFWPRLPAGGYTQETGRGVWLMLEDLLFRELTHNACLLAGGLSSSPGGLSVSYSVSSLRSREWAGRKLQSPTWLSLQSCAPSLQGILFFRSLEIKSSPDSRGGEFRSTSWREEYQRIWGDGDHQKY